MESYSDGLQRANLKRVSTFSFPLMLPSTDNSAASLAGGDDRSDDSGVNIPSGTDPDSHSDSSIFDIWVSDIDTVR